MSDMPRDVVTMAMMLESSSWKQYKERNQERIDKYKKELLNPSAGRKDKWPDDYLRGYIEAIEWSLAWPYSIVEQHQITAEEDAEDRRRQDINDRKARLGSYPGALEPV